MSQSQRRTVKVANPQAGGAAIIKYSRAMRFVRKHRAVMRPDGLLEFLYDEAVQERVVRNGGRIISQMVTEFCGQDAFPGRPIIQSYPSVTRYMREYRGPLVPPLRSNC